MAADVKAFIAQALSKITDPGLRANAEVVFADATIQAELRDGVAGQSEIDRQLQELRAKTEAATTRQAELAEQESRLQQWHDGLAQWRTESEGLVQLGAAAKKANWKPGDPPPNTGGPTSLPAGVVTEEQLRKTLSEFEASVLGYDTDKNSLMRQHYATFGEFLDVAPLIKHPQIRELGLVGVYQLIHKDALASKAKDTQDAHDKKVADEAVAKFQAAQSTMLPYPITSGGPGSGSPLDALSARPDPAAGSVAEQAAAHYARLQQARPA